MTRLRARSLRTQLILMGLATALVPIVVLVVVGIASSTSEEIVGFETGSAGELIEVTGRSENPAVPVPVLIAAVALIIAVIAAVLWWSEQLVKPLRSMAAVADEIQVGSLDRRIGLADQASEVQTLGDNFDAMLDRLAKASTTQQQLIEDASHELRTPLTALAVNTEVILADTNPSVDDYKASARRSEALIERLQLTIDDLLSGARVRNQTARQVDNDLMEIVKRVVDQHRAVRPEAAIRVEGPQNLRLGIDGPSVQRALVNLVENASRYSPKDSEIVVEVRTEPAPTLSVTDRGPGIDRAEQHLIFDRYYRSTHRDERKAGAESERRGIGLALVKQVADAHGHISVESPLADGSSGTRFVITFVGR